MTGQCWFGGMPSWHPPREQMDHIRTLRRFWIPLKPSTRWVKGASRQNSGCFVLTPPLPSYFTLCGTRSSPSVRPRVSCSLGLGMWTCNPLATLRATLLSPQPPTPLPTGPIIGKVDAGWQVPGTQVLFQSYSFQYSFRLLSPVSSRGSPMLNLSHRLEVMSIP